MHKFDNKYDSRMNFLVNALVAAPMCSKDIFSQLHKRFEETNLTKDWEEWRDPETTVEEARVHELHFRRCVSRLERSLKEEFDDAKAADPRTKMDRLGAVASSMMNAANPDEAERESDYLAGAYLKRMVHQMDPRTLHARRG